jgi:hypothetical protein
MPRPLKVFRAHLGFYDTVVAAPSQKAALAAWGSKRDLFREGFASVSNDAEAAEEALRKPGVVLRRAYGSKDPFREDPALPRVRGLKKSAKSAAAETAREQERRRQAEIAKASAKLRTQEETAMQRLRRKREALEREEEKVQSLFAHKRGKLKSGE